MLFSLAICHYIDRDCSFGSYVNKKARNQPLSAGFIVQCTITYDRSICRRTRKKSCFYFFSSRNARTIKSASMPPLFCTNRKFELFATYMKRCTRAKENCRNTVRVWRLWHTIVCVKYEKNLNPYVHFFLWRDKAAFDAFLISLKS